MLCYSLEFQAEEDNSGEKMANLNIQSNLNEQLSKIKGILYAVKFSEKIWKKLFNKADKIEKMLSFI